MELKISVIIPMYNNQDDVKRCIEHLKKQTFKNFEVIFVDDCSIDNSFEITKKSLESSSLNYQLLSNSNNKGPGASRNLAIKVAKGEWFAFCDADDYYSEKYLEIMIKTAGEKDAEIVFCDYVYEDNYGNQKSSGTISHLTRDCKSKDDWIAFSQMSLCRMLIHSKLFHGIELPEIYHCEDAAVIPLLVERAKKCYAIDDKLYYYCLHKNSNSVKRPNKNVCFEILIAYKYMVNKIIENNSEAFKFLEINFIMYSFTLNALKAGMENSLIKKEIREFRKNQPEWYKNKYIKSYDFKKRLFLYLLKNDQWLLLRVFAELHYKMVQYIAK